uniref:Uncharacterized protein n=1 Tax=Ditylum brightwellii TaxID=49249 RepID=A0A7S1ZJN9_9STRA|mmetsp:Transcript_33262/g.49568  ORF Transcript_33262/g.49568 Transcript_33262/m.49568 type:complete len:432 (+) Transcript_33262:113-1408(+)
MKTTEASNISVCRKLECDEDSGKKNCTKRADEDGSNVVDDDDDTSSMNSSDEALCEMLGFSSLGDIMATEKTTESLSSNHNNDDQNTSSTFEQGSSVTSTSSPSECLYNIPSFTSSEIKSALTQQQLNEDSNKVFSLESLIKRYENESILVLPSEISIPSSTMRKLANELIYGENKYPSDKTYETIHYLSSSGSSEEIKSRRVLTRLENFVSRHEGWYHLCHHTIPSILSTVLLQNEDDDAYVLYKEKLNIKPPGGSGFAPHLDTPSLRLVFGQDGPQHFITVMVAIDDMTSENGCLRVVKGEYNSEQSAPLVIPPDENGNPDAEGRAGAMPLEVADTLMFEDILCKGGMIAIFNGWIPHRSAVNKTAFSRRAVFLTYNLKSEGCFRERYYTKMREWRSGWRATRGVQGDADLEEMEKMGEFDALKTIPRI